MEMQPVYAIQIVFVKLAEHSAKPGICKAGIVYVRFNLRILWVYAYAHFNFFAGRFYLALEFIKLVKGIKNDMVCDFYDSYNFV